MTDATEAVAAETVPEEPPRPPFPCPHCGAEIVDAEKEGDWVCGECGEIHLDSRR